MPKVILLSSFEYEPGKKYKTATASCRCGGTYKIRESIYKRGRSSTCGCAAKQEKHGYHKTILYSRWESMKQRCYYSKHASYKNYGARGICVCPEWHTFIPFKEWAENNGFDETLELDRIDNSKNYSPDNCRWVTHSFNNRNTRRNFIITFKGESKSLIEWSELTGISPRSLKHRIVNKKIPLEKLLQC